VASLISNHHPTLFQAHATPPYKIHKPHSDREAFSNEDSAPFELLGSQRMMEVFNLSGDFMVELVVLERSMTSMGSGLLHSPRICVVQDQQAAR